MSYVYRHIREDKNEPFYIGIGSDSNYYRASSVHNRNKHWHNIVNKAAYYSEIILDNLSFEEAKIKEIEFIKLYGRMDIGIGSLVNFTDGGQGLCGRIVSKETRDKLSKANTGKIQSPEQRRKCSESRIGRPRSKETRDKISRAHMGVKLSPMHCRRMSETRRGRPNSWKMTEEIKRKIGIGNKGKTLGRKKSDETRMKMSAFHTGKLKSEETKKRMAIAQTGKKMSLESRKKMSDSKIGISVNKGMVHAIETRKKMSMSRATLLPAQIREIRKLSSEGEMGKAIAIKYNCSRNTIYDILNYKTYKYIT